MLVCLPVIHASCFLRSCVLMSSFTQQDAKHLESGPMSTCDQKDRFLENALVAKVSQVFLSQFQLFLSSALFEKGSYSGIASQ